MAASGLSGSRLVGAASMYVMPSQGGAILAGIPLGVSLLPRLDMDWFRLVLGLLLVLWCPAMLLSQRLPRLAAGGRLADGAVGLAGGIMGGIGGFTGTLPTLWCTLRGYERDVQRAIIQNFNLSMLLVTMGTYLASGIVTRSMWPWFATVLPAMLIPSFIGTRVYIGISDMRFRQIVLGLLILFLYGGVLWGVLPGQPGISWQGHLFGAIGGAIAAFVVVQPRRRTPAPLG